MSGLEQLRLCQPPRVEAWQAQRFANREYEAHWERGVLERGRNQMGSGPRPFIPPPRPEGQLNTTYPDSRRMKWGGAFFPAFNAQAVTTERQIVIAAELTAEGVDFEQLEPMIATAEWELQSAGVKASRGPCSPTRAIGRTVTIDALRERGVVPLIAPDTAGKGPARHASAGPTTACEQCSPRTTAALFTHRGAGWSSPSLPKSSPTAGSTASNAGAY